MACRVIRMLISLKRPEKMQIKNFIKASERFLAIVPVAWWVSFTQKPSDNRKYAKDDTRCCVLEFSIDHRSLAMEFPRNDKEITELFTKRIQRIKFHLLEFTSASNCFSARLADEEVCHTMCMKSPCHGKTFIVPPISPGDEVWTDWRVFSFNSIGNSTNREMWYLMRWLLLPLNWFSEHR